LTFQNCFYICFLKADTVVMMDSYSAFDVTDRAKTIASDHNRMVPQASWATMGASDGPSVFASRAPRIPNPISFATNGKTATRGVKKLLYGDREVMSFF
jgi:hypothetical protein